MKLYKKCEPDIINLFTEQMGKDYLDTFYVNETRLFKGLTDKQVEHLIYSFEFNQIPVEAYVHVEVVLAKYNTLKKSGLKYSKDFHRDVQSIQKKADFLATLMNEELIVPIPIPLADIQAILYHRLRDYDIDDSIIRQISEIIFGKRGFKGSSVEVVQDINRIFDSMQNVLNTVNVSKKALKYRFDTVYIAKPSS